MTGAVTESPGADSLVTEAVPAGTTGATTEATRLVAPHRLGLLGGLLVAMRPRQWIKQLLVLAAPAAAGVLSHGDALLRTLAGMAIFTAAAAGTYLLNDARDVEVDRLHPRKRDRPLASGAVPLGLGVTVGSALMAAAIGAGFLVHWRLGVVIAVYVAMTLAYSLRLKHVAIVELVIVAFGFVLRAIAGGSAVGVPISQWFVIVASFGSLFMVTGKRYAEATTLADGGVATRAILAEYPLAWLRQVRDVCVGVTLLAYCLFAFEKGSPSSGLGAHMALPWYQLSIIPVTIGLFRYSLLLERGLGAAPEEVVLTDRTLQLAGLCWAALFGLGVAHV